MLQLKRFLPRHTSTLPSMIPSHSRRNQCTRQARHVRADTHHGLHSECCSLAKMVTVASLSHGRFKYAALLRHLESPVPMQLTMCYRPHIHTGQQQPDWVHSLELEGAKHMPSGHPPKVMVLYGSLRLRSYSKLLAFEFARILDALGADVRVYDPTGLPIKDAVPESHPKVQELRNLSLWSEAQVWVCPEQHGTITAVFKNQIDWLPLSLGSVRPTQGRMLAVAQVNGGSQSFNVVNHLRILGRWMRMVTIPNQSSVPKAWTEFEEDGRMKATAYRARVVDVAEELYKFTILLRAHSPFLVDRYSEREEIRHKGRLQSQSGKESVNAALTAER